MLRVTDQYIIILFMAEMNKSSHTHSHTHTRTVASGGRGWTTAPLQKIQLSQKRKSYIINEVRNSDECALGRHIIRDNCSWLMARKGALSYIAHPHS